MGNSLRFFFQQCAVGVKYCRSPIDFSTPTAHIFSRSHSFPILDSHRYAYRSKHVADESCFVCDGGTIESRMDIHVRRMANISDMNVQATRIAAMDRASETRLVSTSHSGFGHNALNFHGRMPRWILCILLRIPTLMFRGVRLAGATVSGLAVVLDVCFICCDIPLPADVVSIQLADCDLFDGRTESYLSLTLWVSVLERRMCQFWPREV